MAYIKLICIFYNGLFSDLLFKKLTDAGFRGYKRQWRLNKMGDYISDKIYDVRRKKTVNAEE